MDNVSLELYWSKVIEGRSAEAKLVHPSSIVTAPWVRMKCQFGCTMYGKGYCCPPDTPTPDQMRRILDSYHRGILFHVEAAKMPGRSRKKYLMDFFGSLVDLEADMFKDGYYKVFALLAGPCELCKECAKQGGKPCAFGLRARPSMEGCGIDVYQSARNNGFFIRPLREKEETQNNFCLLLVD